jgi:AsmA family protein
MQRRLVKAAAAVLLGIVALAAGVLFALDAGYLKTVFVRFVSWQIDRPLQVRGALHVRLMTRSPRIEAEQVVIGNPPWTPTGTAAEIGRLTLVFAPLFTHQSGLTLLDIDHAHLHLIRDAKGQANWTRRDPRKYPGGSLPLMRSLQVAHTRVELADDRRHLAYDGNVSIEGSDGSHPLQMEGTGTLNTHPVSFVLKGAPLGQTTAGKPYAFDFEEQSSGTHFTARGSLLHAFDMRDVDADFSARGGDLRDMYFLVGVKLPNTSTFEAKGGFSRRGDETRFAGLKVLSGESDMSGTLTFHSPPGGRTQAEVQLHSTLLRVPDLGLRAAGRDPHPDAPPHLFSDIDLITAAARQIDVRGKISVKRLMFSRIGLDEVSAPFSIERGKIKAPDVTAQLLGGKMALQTEVDANDDPAHVRVDVNVTDLQVAQLPHKASLTPYEGLLHLKVQVQGHGNSMHALASNAEGTVSAQISQGMIRAALAELTGVDLRGLGLLLIHSERQVPIVCGRAEFAVHEGIMQPTRFIVDTEPVSISAEGRVLLGPETLELRLSGTPNKLRVLRLKTPILVQGTLLQPKFSLDTAASNLNLVERGHPPRADCGADAASN